MPNGDDLSFSAEPSGGASGQASDIAIHAKEILRVRQLLTSIYQRHCGRDGESEAAGLERFGAQFNHRPNLNLSPPFLERALERDYFMTGMSFCDNLPEITLISTNSPRSARFRYRRWYLGEETQI